MTKSVLFYFLFPLLLLSEASQLRTERYTLLPKGFWSNISSNSLIYGHHFTFCCHEMPGGLKITRDTIGRTVDITGVEGGLIDWLSRKYHFTFDCIARDLQTVGNIGFSLGSMYYFENGALEQMRIATLDDFIQTRKCNFAYAKETFYPFYYSRGIQKGHPLTELLNQGIVRALETGLMDVWKKRNNDFNYDEVCKSLHQMKQPIQETHYQLRLSFPNLMGPFIILFTGYFTSLLVFGTEKNFQYCILKIR